MMAEADLLKERLQAITDKRRIQEDIAKKRREIEEEKLKFQYIKKKALREQWLMDGLSQQSEEEQEAMRLQAQDEQQQSDQLQTNIQRIEKEIEDLEAQELNISANEEVLLRRLKEVERTAQDIIKELNAGFQADVVDHAPSPLPDMSPVTTLTPASSCHSNNEEPKTAVFTMEISVEHDRKTGRSQVVSTATVTPNSVHGRGLKVYDDGCKSVYALKPIGEKMPIEAAGEMTSMEVEELLRQATDKSVPSEVQYHQPVYSALYTGTSRPSTPRTPEKLQRQMVTPSRSQSTSPANLVQSKLSQEQEGLKSFRKTSSPNFSQLHSMSSTSKHGEETNPPYFDIPGQSKSVEHFIPQSPLSCAKSLTNKMNEKGQATLVSIKARSEGMSEAIVPLNRAKDAHSHKSEVDPVASTENSINLYSVASLNLINNLPSELQSEPVTMIFMGYEKADDEDEEDFQAELVIINSDDDEDDQDEDATSTGTDRDMEECLSYHPEGYKSKVFQPKVALAKVADGRDMSEDTDVGLYNLELHKPTFMHKPGKHGANLQAVDEAAGKGNINVEEMKLCSTER